MCGLPVVGLAVTLDHTSCDHAKQLVRERHVVLDSVGRSCPRRRGEREYRKWFLAIDDEHREGTKARYEFPYSDFCDVHRCGVISAESRAGPRKYLDVENAVAHLHGMLDALD